MTITPLYSYIARQLNTNVLLYTKEDRLLEYFSNNQNLADDIHLNPTILSYLTQTAVLDYPMFSFINGHICYVHFAITDGTLIIGPFNMIISDSNLHAQHNLELTEIDMQNISHIPGVYPPHAIRYALLLFNCYHSQNVKEHECHKRNFHTEYIQEQAQEQTMNDIFANRENQKMHNPYTQEIRLLKCIENGDIKMLEQVWSEPVADNLGTTAKDPVRNGRNMAIYNVTACGRAAIRAGISSEYIFSLTDSYTQQIEELKNMMLLHSLVNNAQMYFAQLVAEHKREYMPQTTNENPLITQCKDYVFQHLHSLLTVQEVANALHVHPNYLSSLFTTHEGKSLYRYILLQKIDLTRNLLTYSEYSYLEIAHYLGFTSQSHLGKHFKSITGMTLRQYRSSFKKESFLHHNKNDIC